MADNSKLPSRDHFFQNNLEVIVTCDICHEPFDAEHTPARIRASEKCQHIFGSTCLRRWLESDADNANTCPFCRAVLFRKLRVPKFTDAPAARAFSSRWVENLDSRYEHREFVRALWIDLWEIYHENDGITDTDVEERIHEALADTTAGLGLDEPLCVRYEHWPALKDVAKAMVREHFHAGEYRILSSHSLKRVWVPKVEAVLGWRVVIDSDNEDDMDMDN